MSEPEIRCLVMLRSSAIYFEKTSSLFAKNQNFPPKPDKMSWHHFTKKSMTTFLFPSCIPNTLNRSVHNTVPSSKFMWIAVSILLSKIQPRGPAWASPCHRPVYHLQFSASIPLPSAASLTQHTAQTGRSLNRLLLPSAGQGGPGCTGRLLHNSSQLSVVA